MTSNKLPILKVLIAVGVLAVVFLVVTPKAQAADVKTEFGVTPGPLGIKQLGEKIYDWALPLGLSITILMLIYAGYVFITSAGNPERVTEAKTIAVYAISGVVLLILLGVVYQAITGRPSQPQ